MRIDEKDYNKEASWFEVALYSVVAVALTYLIGYIF